MYGGTCVSMKNEHKEQNIPEFLKDVHWIWLPDEVKGSEDEAYITLFRKTILLPCAVSSAVAELTADTRYKLYVNGHFVTAGPAKGDRQVWYKDTVDLAKYFVEGENAICVSVLRYPQDPQKGNHSLFRTATPALYFEGAADLEDGSGVDLSADTTWKCMKDESVHFMREEKNFAPLIIHEKAEGNSKTFGWHAAGFDDSSWLMPKVYKKLEIPGGISPGNLYPRPIPYMRRKEGIFESKVRVIQSSHTESEWSEFLASEKSLEIPAHSEEIVELTSGVEKNAYLHLRLAQGMGAKIDILESEAYALEVIEEPPMSIKGDRTDCEHGFLTGYTDEYVCGGFGSDDKPEVYEPFWFRAFRFIRLKITTKDTPLSLLGFDYEETGYPLDVLSHVQTSDTSLESVWDISERTLKLCMQETYMDCPFYEQLQYAQDSRQQILYTYAISADDRLARQCIDDFARSQRSDGLLNCCYPNCNPNIIPGFSIYYILMVYDHMMYFGDAGLVEKHMPVIERILYYFHEHCTEEGYVGKVGGLNMIDAFWSFIDWANEWNDTVGMPPAGLYGPLTMESFLYIMGLQAAEKLAQFIGRNELGQMFLERAKKVQESLVKYCMTEDGLFADGPGRSECSQHCQVFAVLTDTIDLQKGRENLLKTIEHPADFPQCTVAMRFYLFRALEKTGLYEYTNKSWDSWRNMVALNGSTCFEGEYYNRSDCHAWGSLVLYELPCTTLGVRPAAPGFKKAKISPVAGYMDWAKGKVHTPVGDFEVSWKKENGEMVVDYKAPEGIDVLL